MAMPAAPEMADPDTRGTGTLPVTSERFMTAGLLALELVQ